MTAQVAGRDAMPHGQMFFFGEEVASLQRITPEDTYLTTTPLFHGNAQFMAAYPALVAGARLVIRPKFSASRWVDQLRENDVTVTNLIGVMMDFIWKQPAPPDDAENKLRSVYAAPTASSIVKEFMGRFGIEAMVDAFGLTETCAPILSPYGEIRPPGAAGLVASGLPIGARGRIRARCMCPSRCWLINSHPMPSRPENAARETVASAAAKPPDSSRRALTGIWAAPPSSAPPAVRPSSRQRPSSRHRCA
jgi:acyl-CoA synthetase (AMP-forming)/AMP-acid ligase II